MSLTDEQRRMLEESIPKRVIFQKEGRDYVKAGWVIAEANRIFGADGWSHDVVESVHFEANGKPQGRAVVRVSLLHEGVPYALHAGAACGTGRGFDGYHQAVSEAETDALKRALSKFGRRLGLELYLDERTDAGPPKVMTDDMVVRIVDALGSANGDAAKIVAAARARLREYRATKEQHDVITQAIERVA